MVRFALPVAFFLAGSSLIFGDDSAPTPASAPSFETDIRPILKAQCWHCHGEENELKGSLDTRLARFLLKGGDAGPAVVPGKHGESPLYERIAAGEMPPGKKKLSAHEIDVIARWIDAGAPTARPEPETLAAGDVFTSEDRSHWAFQPIVRPAIPIVKQAEALRTPVDAFLLARLEAKGLGFGPEADRVTLIRRLSFDLTGLPPTPEALDRFVNDPATDAYERLVDELLASPAYGERWGRHWLDIAGYADSDGYTEQDLERKWAYRYRDYVVRSLNADKPWNEFLVEQLAGDELLTPPYSNLTAEQADKLIATGFLRMGPDGTGDGNADQNLARNETIAETIKIVSTSLLGLTVGCAQCHSHRYDPISHADYHRIRALFEPAYDWKNWRSPGARLVSLWSDEQRTQVAAIDKELQEISEKRTAELDQIVREAFERELARLPEDLQVKAKEVRETPADKRTPEQQQLVKEYPFLNVDRGSVYLYFPERINTFNKTWDDRTAETRSKRPPEDYVHCLTEIPGQIPPTKLFFRGDFNVPKEEIAPGELAVINVANVTIPADDPQVPTSGRRLAYARHLTSGTHPLTGRVLVNRFWHHHFGRGIVASAGNFGVLGERPSHPELLDWLADEFVKSGWKLKALHRLILNSSAYRQSSVRRDDLDATDPENRLLGRMNVRRLEAETIRDWLLTVSGRMSGKMFGPPVSVAPDDVGQIVISVDTRDSAGRPTGKVIALGEEEFRRSLYVQVRRSMPLGMLEPFDAPIMAPNCEQRNSSTVAPQSLLMMNSVAVAREVSAMAARIANEVGEDPTARFTRAWRLVFGRAPTGHEVQQGVAFLTEQAAVQAAQAPADPKAPRPEPALAALANLCQALVSSNGFLYVD